MKKNHSNMGVIRYHYLKKYTIENECSFNKKYLKMLLNIHWFIDWRVVCFIPKQECYAKHKMEK